jgi:hypothetical protein
MSSDIVPIELLPHQTEHVGRILHYLERNHFAADLSPMGTGKTYCASVIARELGVRHVVVVAPLSVLPKWTYMRTHHGVPVSHALSYCSLRSVKFKQPKHGLLTRVDRIEDVIDENTGATTLRVDTVTFHSTDMWNRMVQEGVLLVIDEVQNVKNVSSQSKSVKELIRSLRNRTLSSPSRVLILSATPIDKTEQSVNLYRLLGVLNRPLSTYNIHLGTTEPYGFRSLVDWHENLLPLASSLLEREALDIVWPRNDHVPVSDDDHHVVDQEGGRGEDTVVVAVVGRRMSRIERIALSHRVKQARRHVGTDKTAYTMFQCRLELNASTVSHVRDSPSERPYANNVYELFCNVFCKYAASAMEHPPTSNANLRTSNAYYDIELEEDRLLLARGVAMIHNATNFDPETGTVRFDTHAIDAMRSVVRALQMIETAKIRTFVRVARAALSRNAQCKVVVSLNYTESINDVRVALADFNPLVLNGSTPMYARGDILEKFQEPSVRYRVLIGNTACLSTGIDLDDKNGSYPRLALVSPNYSVITIHQFTYRFHRIGTMSDADVHILFGRVRLRDNQDALGYRELPVLNALARKSAVLREISLAGSLSAGSVIFPGDFPKWEEPVVDDVVVEIED